MTKWRRTRNRDKFSVTVCQRGNFNEISVKYTFEGNYYYFIFILFGNKGRKGYQTLCWEADI